MRNLTQCSAVVALVLTTLSCHSNDEAPRKDPASAPPPPSSSAPSPIDSYAESELSTRPIELLKFQFTSGVKDREPIDKVTVVHPGERVYAHLTVRNRTGRRRKVHLAFSVNGKERSALDLDVAESWSYRTWGNNTILKTDKPGELTLSVTDDEGTPLDDEKLPIAAH